MAIFIIIAGIMVLSLMCAGMMISKYFKQPSESLSVRQYLTLSVNGIIAFIADTLGVGSFAVNVALAKLTGTFRDDEMPAVNNGAQVIPGTIESLYFIGAIHVDVTTLITLIAGTCIGGLLGGYIVSRLSKQAIRLAMMTAFALLIALLVSHQFRLLPIGGELTSLNSWKLVLGFLALMLCGALTSVGVGLFVMVQGVLFLMNMSPAVAFPIMTAAGAMQQPLTTLVFLQQNKIPLKKTLIMSIAGCFGVFITIPIFSKLTITWLHSLLIAILCYNFITVGLSYLRSRAATHIKKAPRTRTLVAAE